MLWYVSPKVNPDFGNCRENFSNIFKAAHECLLASALSNSQSQHEYKATTILPDLFDFFFFLTMTFCHDNEVFHSEVCVSLLWTYRFLQQPTNVFNIQFYFRLISDYEYELW